MKQILVTGGAGFIGSNFIRHILGKYKNYKIVNLDKLTYCGNRDNLKDVEKNPNYKFVKGDIADPKIAHKLIGGCDIIVNFAAETHVDRSIANSADFVNTNVFGTHVLLEAAKRHGIELYVQISTDEVYGSIIEGAFKETDPLLPNSPYSATKAAGDMLVRAYHVTHNLPVMITRSSNNFGPYQYPEKIIPLFISNALKNKKLPVYADGMNMRDWLFVLDNCEAIDTVMHKGRMGEVYNIGGGREITNLDLTRSLLDILNKPRTLIKFVKDRPGHDKRYALDISKIKALGWQPRHDFTSALAVTVEWYKKNQAWWKKLKKSKAYNIVNR